MADADDGVFEVPEQSESEHHEAAAYLSSLSDDERRFLIRFARDGAAGRHILCLLARIAVGLGLLGVAIAGIMSGLHAVWR